MIFVLVMGTVVLNMINDSYGIMVGFKKLSEDQRMYLMVMLALNYGHLFFQPFIVWNVITCFFSYWIYSPIYNHILLIYSFANIDDVSWGTKGLSDGGQNNKKEQKIKFLGKFLICNGLLLTVLLTANSLSNNTPYTIMAIGALGTGYSFIKSIIGILHYLSYFLITKPINWYKRKTLKRTYVQSKANIEAIFQRKHQEQKHRSLFNADISFINSEKDVAELNYDSEPEDVPQITTNLNTQSSFLNSNNLHNNLHVQRNIQLSNQINQGQLGQNNNRNNNLLSVNQVIKETGILKKPNFNLKNNNEINLNSQDTIPLNRMNKPQDPSNINNEKLFLPQEKNNKIKPNFTMSQIVQGIDLQKQKEQSEFKNEKNEQSKMNDQNNKINFNNKNNPAIKFNANSQKNLEEDVGEEDYRVDTERRQQVNEVYQNQPKSLVVDDHNMFDNKKNISNIRIPIEEIQSVKANQIDTNVIYLSPINKNTKPKNPQNQ